MPEDRHDRVRKAVDTDLYTVRSHEECLVSNVFLPPTSTPPQLAVPVLLHHTSKYLFNVSSHLLNLYKLNAKAPPHAII